MSGYERHPNGFFNRRLFGRFRFSTCYQIATVEPRSLTWRRQPGLHAFDANAQNHLFFTTTFGFVKPAAVSSSGNPLFGRPE
jgi:hypothetical protein